MTLIIIMLFLVCYTAVGARFSRNRYALLKHENDIKVLQGVDPRTVKELQAELKGIRTGPDICGDYQYAHRSKCGAASYRSNVYQRSHCTCGIMEDETRLEARLRQARAGMAVVIEPSVIGPMLLWPGYKFKGYLKSGEVRKPNYGLIEQLEKQELS